MTILTVLFQSRLFRRHRPEPVLCRVCRGPRPMEPEGACICWACVQVLGGKVETLMAVRHAERILWLTAEPVYRDPSLGGETEQRLAHGDR